jgi:creatinine amidohydrolase
MQPGLILYNFPPVAGTLAFYNPALPGAYLMRPWILAETNYTQVKSCQYDVAVLPMGATEPHNLHLPYGTDTFQAEAVASRACEAAWNRGAKVIMLPPIPYGTETNQAQCSLSMNVNPSTLGMLIRDLIDSLAGHGVHRLLILNSHGGNEFKPFLREMLGKTPVQLFLCDWFRGISADVQKEIFDEAGDHAGEMETALGLAYFNQFVLKDDNGQIVADDGAVNATRFDAVNNGWVSITRPWHLLTKNTGSGNPFPATAEKGERLMKVIVDRVSQFLVELAESELDEKFPF